METRELKARLRTTLLAARRALSADERRAAAEAATAGLLASAAWRAARVVALYQAYGAELDTAALRAAAGRKGTTMSEALAAELVDAYNNTGNVVKKREETHKMAQANRAFAHLKW